MLRSRLTHWQDLKSRVLLCLLKIISQKNLFHAAVAARAEECITILKNPSIATSVFEGRLESDQHSFDVNSSLPFLLHPTTDYFPGPPLHAFTL
jgi:hypothetical protein